MGKACNPARVLVRVEWACEHRSEQLHTTKRSDKEMDVLLPSAFVSWALPAAVLTAIQ